MENYSLKEHTTLKIGGNADKVYIPETIREIKEILSGQRVTVIGEGSNLLVSSQGVKENALFTKNLKNYEFLDETVIKVESGLKSSCLAKVLLEKGLSGLEFLIGIPGSIGGAVTMNSSAHGQSIADVIEYAEVIDLYTNEIQILSKSDLKLGYRNSFVEKNRHLILNATFKLKKECPKLISEKMDFHVNYRKNNHPPLTQPSAGSTFRNPRKGVYAGKLLENLGAKQWKEGGAVISDKHCNFIVNTGNATSLDVSRLMDRMHKQVQNGHGYDLIAEIRYIGEFTQEEKEIWSKFTVH